MCGYNDCEMRREVDVKSHLIGRNGLWIMQLACVVLSVIEEDSILLLMRSSVLNR